MMYEEREGASNSMQKKVNVVVVMTDTLRTMDVGCYGSTSTRTPHIDALAARSVQFDRMYPESLPTIPVRRGMHTGRRVYPISTYKPVKWDFVYLPGWQPLDNFEDTLAENLVGAGYHTGFAASTMPYFAPGFNFHRGFLQWEFIRGEQVDKWKSPHAVPRELFEKYGNPDEILQHMHSLVPMYLANTLHEESEEDTPTARLFRWGMEFLEDNVSGQPFYLVLDCFDPHEPWEAPDKYFQMYGDDEGYTGRRLLHTWYGSAKDSNLTAEELDYIRAHYRGLTTMVDAWFGKFMGKLDELGLSDNTLVFFTTDHGTNFCDNPRDVIGKPANAMYPAVMHLPFLLKMPDERGAGTHCNALTYLTDMPATIYDVTGIQSEQGIDGQSLLPLVGHPGTWTPRPYLTCRYSHSLCYIDDDTWAMGNIEGEAHQVFDLEKDPGCQVDISAEAEGRERWAKAWRNLLRDAGGEFKDYRDMKETDAIGQRLSEARM